MTALFPSFQKICDIEPCGIGGRNYPFPTEADTADSYTGIGGGLKYPFYHCDDKVEFCTKEEYLTMQDEFEIVSTGNEEEDEETNSIFQYLAFNSLYAYTVMDLLQIDKIFKPGKGHDTWIFGLASDDVSTDGTDGFLKYLEWSSSRLQLHVFPDTNDFSRFKNINDETIGNSNKYYKWRTNDNDTTDVEFIQLQISLLNESFNESIVAFQNLVTIAADLVTASAVPDVECLEYCSQINEELIGDECLKEIAANGLVIRCGSDVVNTFVTFDCVYDDKKQAPLLASGGLRNNVRVSLDILSKVASASEWVSERNGVISGSEEAMYGFLAANVDVEDNNDLKNVFDFGGQSIQLTKVVRDTDLPAYSNDRNMDINGENIEYYALSVNNFGSVAATEYIQEYWTKRKMDNACLLTTNHAGVFDKEKCLQSLRFMLEPVSYFENECSPDHRGSSSLSNLMRTSFVLMMSYIFM